MWDEFYVLSSLFTFLLLYLLLKQKHLVKLYFIVSFNISNY